MWKPIVLYLFSFLLSTSCVKRVGFDPKQPGEVAVLMQKANERYEKRQTLNALYSFQVKGGLNRLAGTHGVDMILKRPSSVYVSLRSFFEEPLQIMACHQGNCCVMDATNPQHVIHQCGTDMGDTALLPLSAHVLVTAFLGPVFKKLPDDAQCDDKRRECWFLYKLKSGEEEQFDINENGEVLRYRYMSADTQTALTIERAKEDVLHFHIEHMREHMKLEATPREQQWNVKVDDAIFTLH